MEALLALKIAPLNVPHKDLEWIPLADKHFQIKDMMGLKPHLQIFCEIRNSHRNNIDILRIWESNMPIYYLPSMNVLPDFIHLCCANYDPTQRANLTPSGSVLFYITPQSINEMLNFEPTQPLVPLTMKLLLDQGAKLPTLEITRLGQLFMLPQCQPNHPPPYHQVSFNEARKLLIDIISYILGCKTSEFVDETVFVLMSIFTPGQPPAVKYDYAIFIANKIHEQFMILQRERVFKYTSYIYHLLLNYHPDSFQVPLKKIDSKGERRSVIFWTSVFHEVHLSTYTYCEFIDMFIYPATSLLMMTPPGRLSAEM